MDYAKILEQWARIQPDKPCLVEEGRTLTYGRMAALARAYGKKLEGLGIPRQTVLIVRQEPADQLAAFLGA